MNKSKIVFITLSAILLITLFFLIIKNQKIDTENISIPPNYTLSNYTIAEVTNISCNKSLECVTPVNYLMISSCPYTSLCIDNKCNVVCPGINKSFDYKGAQEKITNDKINSCAQKSGVWYSKEGTCEVNQLSESQCKASGGEFNGCASACRHDSKAEICTTQCVLTCTFR